MSTNTSYPIFKFASLRSPDEVELSPDVVEISPLTPLVDDLITINEDEMIGNEEKLAAFNDALQSFIDSTSFIKTKVEFDAIKIDQDIEPSESAIRLLYNNVLVRTFTKSTTNRLFKMLVDQLKSVYAAVHGEEIDNLEIVISERLNLTFTGFLSPEEEAEEVEDGAEVIDQLNALKNLQVLINEAKKENVISFDTSSSITVRNLEHESITSALGTTTMPVSEALSAINGEIDRLAVEKDSTKTFYQNPAELSPTETTINVVKAADPKGIEVAYQKFQNLRTQVMDVERDGVETLEDTKRISSTKYSALAAIESDGPVTIERAEEYVSKEMQDLSTELYKVAPKKRFSQVGERWVETSKYASDSAAYEPLDVQMLDAHDTPCDLKFPFQIADLRVIEQQPVGYLPGEIAHINNTQPGEKNTKVTRRLKKVESYESLLEDEEVFRETDTQSTEKFSLEKEASNAQEASQSFTVNASASAKFGAYSLSVDSGYASSSSSSSANSTSQSHAKEVVQSIVDRVSNRVKRERSLKTIEEFEETVTHEIDNSGQGTKSYVYRWLNKLVRATLKNYGKRLIYQFDVAHPAHYYLSRAIKQLPSISLPPDPRELSTDGSTVLAVDNITRDNYLAWGAIYKTELEQPPVHEVLVAEAFVNDSKESSTKMMQIPKGYEVKRAKMTNYVHDSGEGPHTILTIGNNFYAQWSGGGTMWSPINFWMKNEKDQLPVTILAGNDGFSMNIIAKCQLTEDAYMAWKIKTYNAIVSAYDSLKAEADDQMAGFDPNLPGLHPAKKKQLIMDEIKRETIRKMFRCNPFWVNDSYVVGKEYMPNCCADSHHAEKVRFIERVFDWGNMTYELHPYFYADKSNWSQLLDLSDDDPHFESFLRSSFATIQVPVHRDSLKETAAVNFIRNNSIANYEVVPEDMQPILAELDNGEPTLFTYDLDGNELPEPVEEVDLGIFDLPTNLVILECGTSDGVKPIGFPQSEDDPSSDVIIPKQYSPAIIADSCDV